VSGDAGGPGSRSGGPSPENDHHRGTGGPAPGAQGIGSSHPATAVGAEPSRPPTPAAFGWTRWRAIVTSSWVRFARDRCSISAWSLACRGFLAIFPALIALLGLVHLLHLGATAAQKLTASVDKVLPPGASGVVTEAVRSASHQSATQSVTALIAGIVVALWSVSGGVSTLQVALDIAYEVPDDRRFIARRLRSLPLMLATVILGLAASALSVFGASIGHAIGSSLPFGGTGFTVIWAIVRWLVSVAAITVLLQIHYTYGPNRQAPGWQWTSVGSVVGAGIFVLASLGFSVYVKNFGSYQKIYGALAGAVVLIFWLYLGGLAVLIGAELNAEIEREASRVGLEPTTSGLRI